MDNSVNFSLGIDLGAKNTGLFLVTSKAANNLDGTELSANAYTLVMPDPDKFGYSTVERTAARHRIRGKKRFNLARRLIKLIVGIKLEQYQSQTNTSITEEELTKIYEALFGLLKRRGYTRIETETDLTPLEDVDSSVFSENEKLNQYFNEFSSIAEQWETLSQDLSKVKDVEETSSTLLNNKNFENYFSDKYPDLKSQKKLYIQAIRAIRDDAHNIVSQEILGNRHRTKYLEIIRTELKRDSRLTKVIEAFGSSDNLWRLVGNISNLQLRALRWYFNCPQMFTGDIWDEKSLQSNLIRAFKYLRPTGEQIEDFKALILELKNSKDIIETLCSIDPTRTIPPYENQDNRHPPVDQTLLLNPHSLNKLFGEKWLVWSENFVAKEPALEEKLSEIINCTDVDRKSRSFMGQKTRLSNEYYIASYILQRVLDRVKDADIYSLRKLSSKEIIKDEDIKELSNTLNSKADALEFLSLAKKYYSEVQDAKQGLWLGLEDSILERSDLHPKKKQKELLTLVGNILSSNDDIADSFIKQVWNCKVYDARYSVKSACLSIEKLRKALGNSFNFLYQKAKYIIDKKITANASVFAEFKDLKLIVDKVEKTSNFIAYKLNLSKSQLDRIANPFSLSQLYNLIEEDRDGFSKTTKAVHKENSWRMIGNKGNAMCSRLPADSVRPFDGVLRKNLDRQAFEITKELVNKIKEEVKCTNSSINLALLIEQNRFSFTEDLKSIKGKKVDKNKKDPTENLWLDKEARIKASSRMICAYTGESISDTDGEIDHIIPRSSTKKGLGTIFNTEANLIYVSRTGNQNKKENNYFLSDLKDNYLEKIFNTCNHSEIEQEITQVVSNLKSENRLGFWNLLNQHEQDCVRHALFLPFGSDARKLVEDSLMQSSKSMVNGTQSWFIRQVVEKLNQQLQGWSQKTCNKLNFKTWKIDANDSIEFRSQLAQQDPKFEKVKPQPVLSHSIDAMCVFAAATSNDAVVKFSNTTSKFSDLLDCKDLIKLFPKQGKVIQVETRDLSSKDNFASRPIFKEGILKEDFLHLIQCKGQLFAGFTLNSASDNSNKLRQAIEVKLTKKAKIGTSPLSMLNLLADYLDKTVDLTKEVATYTVNKAKTFELFTKIAQGQKFSAEEIRIANILNSLKFVTKKVEISSLFVDQNSKINTTLDKLRSTASFNQKFSCKDQDFEFSGSLLNNSYSDLKTLFANPEIEKLFNVSDKKLDVEAFNAAVRKQRKVGSKLSHSPSKRACSISVFPTTGGLFRIKRTNIVGKNNYQLYDSYTKFEGYIKNDNGSADWKRPAVYSALNTKNITPNDIDNLYDGNTIKMTQWRYIGNISEDIRLAMRPNSEGRCMLKITLPFELFRKIIKACNNEDYSSFLRIPPSVKLLDPASYSSCFNEDLKAIVGKPRSVLFIDEIGNRVTYRYIVDSTSAKMKELFNQATSNQ